MPHDDRLTRIERKLDFVIALLRHQGREIHIIMADIDDLEAQLTPLTNTTDGVLALITEVLARVDAANAGNNPRIRAVTDGLRSNIDRLAAAVVAGTGQPPVPPS